MKCSEGRPTCYYRTNVCFCRRTHDNLPFTCKTVADCVRQLKCINGTPSCFASRNVCYCKLPNSRPNNETRCNNDADCGVLLKCLDPRHEKPTCFLKSHNCYCKRDAYTNSSKIM